MAARRIARLADPGGVPERSKGRGCKPRGSAFAGSNPAPAISLSGARDRAPAPRRIAPRRRGRWRRVVRPDTIRRPASEPKESMPVESSAPARVLIVAHRTAATPGAPASRREARCGESRGLHAARPEGGARPASRRQPRGHRRARRPGRSSSWRSRCSRRRRARTSRASSATTTPWTRSRTRSTCAASTRSSSRRCPCGCRAGCAPTCRASSKALGLPVTTVTAKGTDKPIPKRPKTDDEEAA